MPVPINGVVDDPDIISPGDILVRRRFHDGMILGHDCAFRVIQKPGWVRHNGRPPMMKVKYLAICPQQPPLGRVGVNCDMPLRKTYPWFGDSERDHRIVLFRLVDYRRLIEHGELPKETCAGVTDAILALK